ncbi:MAG: DNA-3-methyladenine glycosylase 2 family protein [Clostridiales bacterium]|nr:DNA-3-methyladenine glycosylase 2 family protein [Clostridiales bacterium]
MTELLEKTNIEEFIDPDGTPCVRIGGIENFLVSQVFDCGQCFRFDPVEGSNYQSEFEGVALGRYVRFRQNTPDMLEIYNSTLSDYESMWKHYLSLDEDYTAVRADIAERFNTACGHIDMVMPEAMKYGEGIRILRQEPWEAVCSFIVSQNNNIPRIKKIISDMSRVYGTPIEHNGNTYYTFPTATALANAGVEGLFSLKTGFRAKYIYDAARKVIEGDIDFDEILAASPDRAMEILLTIKGVGPKVASCAMLFGFGKTEAFPIDVWIKRVLAKYYPEGLDISKLGKYAGIAQQYLFYYERYQN